MALDLRQHFVSAQYPENKCTELTKYYICIHIDKIYIGIFTHHFSLICTRVMALDLRQNFVSVQYLANKWTEFNQILYMHSYLQDLPWDCNT